MRRLFPLLAAGVLVVLPLAAASAAEVAPRLDDGVRIAGAVTVVLVDGFQLDAAGSLWRVVVDDDTDWEGPTGLGELASGSLVEVDGELVDGEVAAARVRWLDDDGTDDGGGDDGGGGGEDDGGGDDGGGGGEDDGGGDDGGGDGGGDGGDDSSTGLRYDSRGFLLELIAPARFRLDDGRVYVVDADTDWKDGLVGYGDLETGQLLDVRAVRTGGTVDRALEVELEDEGDERDELEGTVTDLLASGFVLDGTTTVLVTPTTSFDGDADGFEDLAIGWRVEAATYVDNAGDLVALSVRAETDAPSTVDGEEFEPRQALVVPVPGADPSAIAARHGAEVLGQVGGLAVLLEWSDEIDNALLAALESDPEVAAVEPNYRFRDPESVRRRYVIVDRSLTGTDFASQAAVSSTSLPAAKRRASGRGIVVALLDTGLDPTHPELAGRVLAGGLDLVDGDLEPWETRDGLDQDGDGDIDEAAGHGTFVASIVALGAPSAALLPYRVLDDDGGGTAYDLAVALADAIERQVDVVNLSLVYHRRSTAVDLLLERAAAAGVVVVASAGNDAATVLPFPASDRHVVAVTALAGAGPALAGFANRAPKAWLAAPGEEILGAVDGGGYGRWSGTSMAAPFVTAVAALMLDADEQLDPTLLAEALRQGGAALTDGLWQGVSLDAAGAITLVGRQLQSDPRTVVAAQ